MSRVRDGTARSGNPARDFACTQQEAGGVPVRRPSAPRAGITVHPTAGWGCPSLCRPGSGRSSPRTSSRSAGNSPRRQWPPAGRSAPGKRHTAPRWERAWGCCCPAPKTPARRGRAAHRSTRTLRGQQCQGRARHERRAWQPAVHPALLLGQAPSRWLWVSGRGQGLPSPLQR